jgi:hypothetical protein
MRIITFDASLLNVIQNCFRKAQYSFVYNLEPHEREESLERGDLMHKMLEVYYGMLGPQKFTAPIWNELFEAGIKLEGDPAQVAIQAGVYLSTKLSISLDTCEEVIKHFRDYAEYYRFDEWHPLAVEEVGSKPFYEEDDLQIIYQYKIDLIAEKGRTVAPFDHKTGKQRKEPLSLSNQFIGYCFALNCNHIVLNKIGFQKTLSPAERFQRYIFHIEQERIDEWRKNAIWWIKQYARCIETNHFPMNLTSCDKYAGCIFRNICDTAPSNREYRLARDFSAVEKWDVAKSFDPMKEEVE